MPDRPEWIEFYAPPPLPGYDANRYAHGHVSGAITEPEQPLVVLGDEDSGMDDVMVLDFVGATITDLGGNVAQIEIDTAFDVTSNAGNAFSATSLDFVDVDNVFESGSMQAVIQIFPNKIIGSQHFLIQNPDGSLRWSNPPGTGTFILGFINGVLNNIATTTCS